MDDASTLAYYDTTTITVVIGFIEHAPGLTINVIPNNISNLAI